MLRGYTVGLIVHGRGVNERPNAPKCSVGG
jgi:hypothetical protein